MNQEFGHFISKLVSEFGYKVLSEQKAANILADYGCKDKPLIRILQTVNRSDAFTLTDFADKNSPTRARLYHFLVSDCAYNSEVVNYFLDCVEFGLGHRNIHPHSPHLTSNEVNIPGSVLSKQKTHSHPANNSLGVASFLSVPLGSPLSSFQRTIKNKGGKFVMKSGNIITFKLPHFIEIPNWYVELYIQNMTTNVEKVIVSQKIYSFSQRLAVIKRLVDIYSLKYGFPLSQSTWQFEKFRIQIRSSINLDNNVVIDYSIICKNYDKVISFTKPANSSCCMSELEFCLGVDKLHSIISDI